MMFSGGASTATRNETLMIHYLFPTTPYTQPIKAKSNNSGAPYQSCCAEYIDKPSIIGMYFMIYFREYRRI
jgi:hypothetical protein